MNDITRSYVLKCAGNTEIQISILKYLDSQFGRRQADIFGLYESFHDICLSDEYHRMLFGLTPCEQDAVDNSPEEVEEVMNRTDENAIAFSPEATHALVHEVVKKIVNRLF